MGIKVEIIARKDLRLNEKGHYVAQTAISPI